MVFPGEREAMLRAIHVADIYGYGNTIAHLKRIWAIRLIEEGVEKKAAKSATDVKGYPVDTDYLAIGNGRGQ